MVMNDYPSYEEVRLTDQALHHYLSFFSNNHNRESLRKIDGTSLLSLLKHQIVCNPFSEGNFLNEIPIQFQSIWVHCVKLLDYVTIFRSSRAQHVTQRLREDIEWGLKMPISHQDQHQLLKFFIDRWYRVMKVMSSASSLGKHPQDALLASINARLTALLKVIENQEKDEQSC